MPGQQQVQQGFAFTGAIYRNVTKVQPELSEIMRSWHFAARGPAAGDERPDPRDRADALFET